MGIRTWLRLWPTRNVVFYELGRRLTADQMAAMAKAFGLSPDWPALYPPESTGAVPDSATREFMPGERLSYAIGQQVTVTPLQMAAAYGGIAMRGSICTPHLVRQVVTPEGSVVAESEPELARSVDLSKKTWDFLHASLTEVTRTCTAAWAISGFPIPTAGKTGTAVARGLHAWFAG